MPRVPPGGFISLKNDIVIRGAGRTTTSRGASWLLLAGLCKDETRLVLEISGSIEEKRGVPGLGNTCMCVCSGFTLCRPCLAVPCLPSLLPSPSLDLLLPSSSPPRPLPPSLLSWDTVPRQVPRLMAMRLNPKNTIPEYLTEDWRKERKI